MICPGCNTRLGDHALACHVCGASFRPPRPPTRYAGFWRRVVAVFIDLFLMAPAFFIAKDYCLLPFSPEEQHSAYEMFSGTLTPGEYQQIQMAMLMKMGEFCVVLYFVMAPYYIATESSAM